MNQRTEQKAATRRALVGAARDLFTARGYAGVSLPEVVAEIGVTKGALYHQFASKEDLFRAVLESVQAEVADEVLTAAETRGTAWDQLLAGCEAFLTASTSPDVERIMLVEAPAILGWSEWRALDAATSMRHLQDVLAALIEEGTLAPQPLEPLVHLISGALNEAALWLAAGDGSPTDLKATMRALERMLGGLR